MPQTERHPSVDQLRDFAFGRLAGEVHEQVENHLHQCDGCSRKMDALTGDSFLGRLRDADTPAQGLAETRAPHQASSETSEERVPAELEKHTRYRIIERLGSGGMGIVYRAEHRLMETMVALKVIRRDFTRDPRAVERFRQEVRAAARLKHPNIVAVKDAEHAGEVHFLVMELVNGTSLAELVERRGALPVLPACNYVRQAAKGLEHAHQQGVVHRDIKPHNLMVGPDGRVTILDFGLAGFARDATLTPWAGDEPSDDGLTRPGDTMGTPDYIAPEQAMDAYSADIRADIYSLGCTLYFLLSGKVPFPEGSSQDKLVAHRARQPQSLAQISKDIPAPLVEVVGRMMAKDPAHRYQTPEAVVTALAPFAGTKPSPAAVVEASSARPVSPPNPLLPPAMTPTQAPRQADTDPLGPAAAAPPLGLGAGASPLGPGANHTDPLSGSLPGSLPGSIPAVDALDEVQLLRNVAPPDSQERQSRARRGKRRGAPSRNARRRIALIGGSLALLLLLVPSVMVARSLLSGNREHAPLPSSPLSSLSDEFTDPAVSLALWQVGPAGQNQCEELEVADGRLRMVPSAQHVWYNEHHGAMLFQPIRGDFIVSAKLGVKARDSQTRPPGTPFTGAGVIARSPTSAAGAENWLHVMLGRGPQSESAGTKTETTTDSVSRWAFTPLNASVGEVRLCRAGSTFYALRRMEGETEWTALTWPDGEIGLERPDLPESLEVGIAAGSALINSHVDMAVDFDHVRFGVPLNKGDCSRPLRPANR